MSSPIAQSVQEYVAYMRDMGIADLYTRASTEGRFDAQAIERLLAEASRVAPAALPAKTSIQTRAVAAPPRAIAPSPFAQSTKANAPPVVMQRPEPTSLPAELSAPMPRPKPLDELFPMSPSAVAPAAKAAALEAIRTTMGDCTRCPLAYAGRHTIVFCDGDPNAELMFVGEGPGADEDATGIPFVGKAGQLLNNMIVAMGLARESVFIANIVKCRPPGNRAPEFVEASTCTQFLAQQIDVVRPKVIVALGKTAANYLLGNTDSLASQRGQWFATRGSKLLVTYHPAYLLRDPRQKVETWKDLQLVMKELGLSSPKKS